MPYSLAIFDLDGTLADSFPWFLRTINGVADRFGFRRVVDEDVEGLRHASTREILNQLEVPLWKLPAIAQHARRLKAGAAAEISLFVGVETMLRELAEHGVQLALVTSDSEANAREKLGDAAALFSHFDCAASVFGKPAKFRRVIRRAGVAPAEVIAIGDEVRDIEAARAVGIACGAVSWGYAAPAALQALAPDHMFTQMDEIADIVCRIPQGLIRNRHARPRETVMTLTDTARLKLLEPPVGKVRVVLDTDTYNEIDDQFALVQMLLSKDRFDVEAIYAAPFFNTRADGPGHGMELSYQEILRLLERLNIAAEGLVHRGVTDYVGRGKTAQAAPAVDDLVARARAGSPDNPLYVVAIGAISNVASALLKAPDIIDRTVVVWLGGHALEWPHTIEFNLKQDVGGAQVLLDSGVPLVLVPCKGVTSHLHSTVPEIERYVEPHGSIGAFLAQRFKEYSSDHLGWAKEIWDMAPVGWLLNPDWAPSVIIPAPIVTEQMTWSIDRRRHAIRYVTYVDRNPILKDFFLKLKAFAGSK